MMDMGVNEVGVVRTPLHPRPPSCTRKRAASASLRAIASAASHLTLRRCCAPCQMCSGKRDMMDMGVNEVGVVRMATVRRHATVKTDLKSEQTHELQRCTGVFYHRLAVHSC